MRNPHAGQPFTTSDVQIAEALLDVSIPTLMLSLVHMSGDPSLIRGELKPAGLFLNEVQGYMSEEDKAAVAQDRAGGDRRLPRPRLPGARADRPGVVAGDDAVAGLRAGSARIRADAARGDGTRRQGRVERSGGTPADDFPVVVIGCGESGLLAGIRLKEAGIPFTIVEKNAGVGGTWWQNTYPGARVDVGNHFYCYSFEPTDQWTHFFAEQPELQAYFQTVMDKYDIGSHVLWETEVTEASWDDATATWSVRARDRNGATTTLSARAVISAVGQLNRPHLPDIDGQQDFAGPAFHSSEWDHSVDLRGKRVAMIGAGASGFQIAPAIAGDVDRLTVFQRTAQWMFPNPNYHAEVGPGVQWALRHLPFYGRWYRFLLFWPGCDKGLEAARVDADYPDQQTAVSEINEITRIMFTEWISSQVGDDAELLAKVVPDYPATGKRTLQDNGSWLRTLTRDNVELVRTGIDRIESDAVVTADGTRYPADVIVYATGFQANKMLWPMSDLRARAAKSSASVGASGRRRIWASPCRAIPNFFCMYGPGTNLAHGGSLIFHSECQMRYITECLELLIAGGHASLEPREDKATDWHERSQAEMRKMVWSQPSIKHSFYKNSFGEVHILSPWRLVDYWAWTREPNPDDFVIR